MKKNVNVYIPDGKHVFYANFRVKVKDQKTGRMVTKQVNRSTGSPSRATAQAIANKMRDDALMGMFEITPRFRDDGPTLGDVITLYRSGSAVESVEQVLKSFTLVLREGLNLNCAAKPKQREEAVAKLKVSVLTDSVLLAFRDGEEVERANTSINTHIRMAKSVFSKRARELYRHLSLPDLTPWLEVAALPENTDTRFRRIPDAILARMDAEASGLLEQAREASGSKINEYRNAWATYWLMRRCGLRNSEVEFLQWEWFERRGETLWLNLYECKLSDGTEWWPKGSGGEVPVAPDLHAALLAEFSPSDPKPTGYVLAGTPTDRKEGSARLVSEFVRPFVPDRTKAAYELRKQWGSEMARTHGLETAAKLLRHADPKTTWDHYYDDLKLNSVAPL